MDTTSKVWERGHGSPGWGGRAGVTSYKITIAFRREFFEHSENETEWNRELKDAEIPGCVEGARSSLRGRRVADRSVTVSISHTLKPGFELRQSSFCPGKSSDF